MTSAPAPRKPHIPTDPPRHTPFEDAQGLVFGSAMCAFAAVMLQGLGLVTGQTAGLALVLSYLTGWSFSLLFIVVNLPFAWLAIRRMGLRFSIKTAISLGLVSVFAALLPRALDGFEITPIVGAVYAGMITGAGLLAVFRHGASLGGVGILALYLQDRTGFRAGWTQLLFDVGVFALAMLMLAPSALIASLVGAVVLNLIIALNHRRDRYIAM